MIAIKQNSTWAKTPMWRKRISGFFSYQLFAFASLLFPVEADKAMYKTLRTQFEEKST